MATPTANFLPQRGDFTLSQEMLISGGKLRILQSNVKERGTGKQFGGGQMKPQYKQGGGDISSRSVTMAAEGR